MLTVRAWKRGWRTWALLPVGFALVWGFAVGANAAANGSSGEDLLLPCLVGDLLAVGALVVLNYAATKKPAGVVNIASAPPAELADTRPTNAMNA